jgi:hypothetical protein
LICFGCNLKVWRIIITYQHTNSRTYSTQSTCFLLYFDLVFNNAEQMSVRFKVFLNKNGTLFWYVFGYAYHAKSLLLVVCYCKWQCFNNPCRAFVFSWFTSQSISLFDLNLVINSLLMLWRLEISFASTSANREVYFGDGVDIDEALGGTSQVIWRDFLMSSNDSPTCMLL